jgi:hypothetical protein
MPAKLRSAPCVASNLTVDPTRGVVHVTVLFTPASVVVGNYPHSWSSTRIITPANLSPQQSVLFTTLTAWTVEGPSFTSAYHHSPGAHSLSVSPAKQSV